MRGYVQRRPDLAAAWAQNAQFTISFGSLLLFQDGFRIRRGFRFRIGVVAGVITVGAGNAGVTTVGATLGVGDGFAGAVLMTLAGPATRVGAERLAKSASDRRLMVAK